MAQDKAASYLGLARRAGKLVLGVNAVSTVRSCYLLVGDAHAGKNSRKEMEKFRERFHCPLVACEGLGDMVGKPGCVLAAVREEHLAAAIAGELGAYKEGA